MSNVNQVLKVFGLRPSVITRPPESYGSEVHDVILEGGERVIVKIPYNKGKLAREQRVLARLQGALPVPVVLDVWEGDEEITGALLLSAIPGKSITGPVDASMAYQMGQMLARLHEIPAPGFGHDTMNGFEHVKGNRWFRFVEDSFSSWGIDCQTVLDHDLYRKCCSYFEQAISSMPEPSKASMIHMDFRPGNLLAEGNRLTGVIDFESARGGAVELDFVKIQSYVWDVYPATKRAFMDGYRSVSTVSDLETCLPFYTFFNAFGGVSWCKRRGIVANQAFLKENVDTLRAVMHSSNKVV